MRRGDALMVQDMALGVHAVLCALHLLGVAYNVKRGNRLDLAAHVMAAAYDARCVYVHACECGRLRGDA